MLEIFFTGNLIRLIKEIIIEKINLPKDEAVMLEPDYVSISRACSRASVTQVG
jgi:hypothetical protein